MRRRPYAAAQIGGIVGLAERRGASEYRVRVEIAKIERDLLGAGDLMPRRFSIVRDGSWLRRRLTSCTGVEPGSRGSATQAEIALLQIGRDQW